MSTPLSREEFTTYMELLRENINDGFAGVHRRQDTTNGRISKNEAAQGELADRVLRLETVKPASTMRSLGSLLGAGGVGGVVTAILEYFSK